MRSGTGLFCSVDFASHWGALLISPCPLYLHFELYELAFLPLSVFLSTHTHDFEVEMPRGGEPQINATSINGHVLYYSVKVRGENNYVMTKSRGKAVINLIRVHVVLLLRPDSRAIVTVTNLENRVSFLLRSWP